jgi:hypothetical protein
VIILMLINDIIYASNNNIKNKFIFFLPSVLWTEINLATSWQIIFGGR